MHENAIMKNIALYVNLKINKLIHMSFAEATEVLSLGESVHGQNDYQDLLETGQNTMAGTVV